MHPLIKEACLAYLRNHGYTVRSGSVSGCWYVEYGSHTALLFQSNDLGRKENWYRPLVNWNPPHEADPGFLDSLLCAVDKFFRTRYINARCQPTSRSRGRC